MKVNAHFNPQGSDINTLVVLTSYLALRLIYERLIVTDESKVLVACHKTPCYNGSNTAVN